MDSQFEITLGPQPALDNGDSIIFGVVLEGQAALDAVENVRICSSWCQRFLPSCSLSLSSFSSVSLSLPISLPPFFSHSHLPFPLTSPLSFLLPFLPYHTQVPIYAFESAGDQPDALNELFSQQKKLFLSVAKSLNDERAVNRQGSFLKRVEVLNVGVL